MTSSKYDKLSREHCIMEAVQVLWDVSGERQPMAALAIAAPVMVAMAMEALLMGVLDMASPVTTNPAQASTTVARSREGNPIPSHYRVISVQATFRNNIRPKLRLIKLVLVAQRFDIFIRFPPDLVCRGALKAISRMVFATTNSIEYFSASGTAGSRLHTKLEEYWDLSEERT